MDAVRNPERNLSVKLLARNLNRHKRMNVANVGVTKLQAENDPDPKGAEKKRLIRHCHWMLAQAQACNLIKNYRRLS